MTGAAPVTALPAALVTLAAIPEPEDDEDDEDEPEVDIDPEELVELERLLPLLLMLELPPVTELRRELGAPVTEERIDPALVREERRLEL